MTVTAGFNGVGIWSTGLRWGDPIAAMDAAVELEELGFTALWIPDTGGDVFGSVDRLLGATKEIPVATGVLNLWKHPALETAQGCAKIAASHGKRLLLGIGVSHAPIVDKAEPGRYQRPLQAMRSYLDELDEAAEPVSADARILAALGPKMLELSKQRASGAHPYNVAVDHVAVAREILGPGPALLPEVAVVLEGDPAVARCLGRQYLSGYVGYPNYVANWRRLGFGEEDFLDGGSDRLVDAVIAWGDEDAIAAKVRAYFQAGADHVAVQIVSEETFPRLAWQRVAEILVG